jgi:hypothetical protein
MGDVPVADEMDVEAEQMYRAALALDPSQATRAWHETGNRDAVWLKAHSLAEIPAEKVTR